MTAPQDSGRTARPASRLLSGLRALAVARLRRMEIGDLKKRLREEQRLLGERIASLPRSGDQVALDQEALLCLRQIDFLTQEIGYLEGQAARPRT